MNALCFSLEKPTRMDYTVFGILSKLERKKKVKLLV